MTLVSVSLTDFDAVVRKQRPIVVHVFGAALRLTLTLDALTRYVISSSVERFVISCYHISRRTVICRTLFDVRSMYLDAKNRKRHFRESKVQGPFVEYDG